MSLGKNIAARRKALKLSQEFVAGQLGVSRQAVSKWESGQTEPTARNLVELARLFGVTVSELVEPETLSREKGTEVPSPEREEKAWKRRNLEIIAVGAYTGFAVLSTVRTEDSGFYVYVSALIFLAAIIMAIHIARLPKEIRRKMAVKELGYCVTVYCLVTFLPSRIGNVYTSLLVIVCCVLYAVYIRFPEPGKKRSNEQDQVSGR